MAPWEKRDGRKNLYRIGYHNSFLLHVLHDLHTSTCFSLLHADYKFFSLKIRVALKGTDDKSLLVMSLDSGVDTRGMGMPHSVFDFSKCFKMNPEGV